MQENNIIHDEFEYVPKDLTSASPEEIAREAARILWLKKARGIKILKVCDSTVLTDYFVICNGTSNTQIRGLAGEAEYRLGQCGIKPHGVEGYGEASWVLLDFTSVIIHIFNRVSRDFYKLEKLWSTAEEIDISTILPDDVD